MCGLCHTVELSYKLNVYIFNLIEFLMKNLIRGEKISIRMTHKAIFSVIVVHKLSFVTTMEYGQRSTTVLHINKIKWIFFPRIDK